MICHYRFFNHGFKFQDSISNGCHDLTTLSVNISDIAIVTVKDNDYRCIMHNISKSEAIDSLKNSVLKNDGYIEKNIVMNFNLLKAVFLVIFLKYLIVNIV